MLPAFALSFLDALPPASAAGGEGSEAVIGWLPAQTSVEGGVEGAGKGEVTQGEGEGSTLDDFVENGESFFVVVVSVLVFDFYPPALRAHEVILEEAVAAAMHAFC